MPEQRSRDARFMAAARPARRRGFDVQCLNDLPALILIEKEPVSCFIEIRSAGEIVAHLTNVNCQLATPATRQALIQRRKCAPRIGWRALMSRPAFGTLLATQSAHICALSSVTCGLGAEQSSGRRLMIMVNLRPLHDRVVIKRLEEQEQLRGGIIIPDIAKEKQQQGEVIAVGSGKALEDGKRIPLDLKVGDRVLFGKYAGTEITVGDDDLLILREEEVLSVIEQTGKSRSAET
jgi:chaperonin GroES